MKIRIENIHVNEGRRELNESKVDELIDSIKNVGLINPITVLGNNNNNKYILIAGLHRLKAHEKMELFEIEANVRIDLNGNLNPSYLELIEIDENLIRNVLHYTERSDALVRRKEIYEELYPWTKQGGDRKSEEYKSRIPTLEKPSFVEDTSNRTGRSETVIKEELKIGTNLDQEEKQMLRDQDINKTESIKLARMEPEERKPVFELFGTGQAKKVEEAKLILDPIDEQYQRDLKRIDKEHDNHKLVANLINETKFLKIDNESVEDYLNLVAVESFKMDFNKNCDRLINKLNEMKVYNSNLNKIRRVK